MNPALEAPYLPNPFAVEREDAPAPKTAMPDSPLYILSVAMVQDMITAGLPIPQNVHISEVMPGYVSSLERACDEKDKTIAELKDAVRRGADELYRAEKRVCELEMQTQPFNTPFLNAPRDPLGGLWPIRDCCDSGFGKAGDFQQAMSHAANAAPRAAPHLTIEEQNRQALEDPIQWMLNQQVRTTLNQAMAQKPPSGWVASLEQMLDQKVSGK